MRLDSRAGGRTSGSARRISRLVILGNEMKKVLMALAALGGLMAVGTLSGHAADLAGQHERACAGAKVPAVAGHEGYVRLQMNKIAAHTDSDPHGIWTDWDIWNPNTPQKTDIYEADYHTCEGTVIVSQIVNRQCGTSSECPGRVVLRRADGEARVLLDYKQMCTAAGNLWLKQDLSELVACEKPLELK